jgi:hypothetical protein
MRPYSTKHDLGPVLGNTPSSYELKFPLRSLGPDGADNGTAVALLDGVDHAAVLWEYAAKFQSFMHSDSKHKLPQSAFRGIHDGAGANFLMQPALLGMMVNDNFGRIGNLHFSNLGNCSQYPRDYGDKDGNAAFRLLEWHAMTSLRMAGFDIAIFTATFHGEMFFDLQFTEPLMAREQADAILDEAMRLIAGASVATSDLTTAIV